MNRIILALLFLLTAGCQPAEDGTELYTTGEQAFASGRFILAEQTYEQLLQQYPESPRRWEAWSRLLLISEQVRQEPKRTMEILQSMSLEYERDRAKVIEILQRMATVYRDGLAQPEKAIDVWERSLAYCEGYPGACWQSRWDMAATYLGWGRYAEARQELAQCLKLANKHEKRARVLYTMAKTYVLTGEEQEALPWLEQVLELGDGAGDIGPQAAFLAADIHVQAGRTAAAQKLLNSILSSHPNPQLVQLRLEQISAQK